MENKKTPPTTTSAHTPGPWFLSRSENPNVYQGEPHLLIVDGKTHSAIADVETQPEAEANAHLIAAAPELLDACNYALGFVRAAEKADGHIEPTLTRRALEVAIAKAKGKAA